MPNKDFLNQKHSVPFQNGSLIRELAFKIDNTSGTYALFGFNYVSKYLSFYLRNQNKSLLYIIDNDPEKNGWNFNQTKVINFSEAEKNPPDNIVICSTTSAFEMLSQIRKSCDLTKSVIITPIQKYNPWEHSLVYKKAFGTLQKSGLMVTLTKEKLSMIFELLKNIKTLEGEIAEIGCAGCSTSFFIKCILDAFKLNKHLFLFDLFENDTENWWDNFNRIHYGQCIDQIESLFNKFQNVKLVKGDVLKTLPEHLDKIFCFVHIDIGSIDYEITELLYSRMIKGGVILYDNYSEHGISHWKSKTDLFFENKPEKIIFLPTGQGLFIKQ